MTTWFLGMNAKKHRLLRITLLFLSAFVISNCTVSTFDELFPKSSVQETRTAEKNHQYEVSEIFLEIHDSVNNPEVIFGKPISHAYTNPNNGSLSQYFENIRLETMTDGHGHISVAVSDLGSQLNDAVGKEMLIIDEKCTHFGDNEIPICHEIRKFYEKNNGEVLFGEPVSHVFEQNARYYQYFTNVCLIWEPLANVVTLAPLGDTYLSSREPLRYTITDSSYPELMIVEKEQPSELNVLYSVEHPFISPHWEQTVTVFVTNEDGEPVENASISAWVILPNGHYEIYRPEETNRDGISSFTIPALANTGVERDDLVKMRIEVDADGNFGQVIGWFRIWL